MSKDTEIDQFTREDRDQFRDWLRLNYDALTWQGRYRKEFEDFWELFFSDDLKFKDLIQRFEFAQNVAKVGPLISWFGWLKSKFVIYLFVYKNLSIQELSFYTQLSPMETGHILRSYLVECFPRHDDDLSDFFQISHVVSPNLVLRMSDIRERLDLRREVLGSHDDEIMPSMEVTLYEEWGVLLEKLRKNKGDNSLSVKAIQAKISWDKQKKILRDVCLLAIVSSLVILGITKFNQLYEKYLVEKISIYEPQFQWLDRSLIFKSNEESAVAEFNLDIQDLEDVVDVAGSFSIEEDEERFDPESEVVLTSWDALPRDFSVANLEVSSFEELSSGGYRDTRFGRTKVYRVMMKSVDLMEVRKGLDKLLDRYSVTQADNVRPGQVVPGGLYYNLFVPVENLKEFLAQVMEVDDSILYESRTRAGRNPVGQNKVFIWVKSI